MICELLSNLNWLAILAGALAFWFLGSIWYSALFSKPWIKAHHVDINNPDAKKGMAMMFIGSFILMFIACTGLAVVLKLTSPADALDAAQVGLLLGITFSFTAQAVNYVYLKKPAAAYAIDGGYQVVGMVIAAVILKLIG